MFRGQESVTAFHRKHGFPIDAPLETRCPKTMGGLISEINDLSAQALEYAQHLGSSTPADADTGFVRIHLILEECAELAAAIHDKDEVQAADAIADLLYVVLGAAVSFNIPAWSVFEEVCASNDTKAVRDPDDTRLRSKGASYVPANIQMALDRGRSEA